MNQNLNALITYLIKLSLRERLLVLLVLIAVIYAIWDGVIYKQQNQHYQQLQEQQQQLANFQKEKELAFVETATKLATQIRTKEGKKLAIVKAESDLQDVNVALKAVLSNLVPPTKITELLHSLLLQTHGLKLLELNNEPVTEIALDEPENPKENATNSTLLYKHSTIMKLSGNYQQLYHYLLNIEQSKWNLYWDSLEYQVNDYPYAEITIRVYTISTDKHWIGL